MPLTFPTVTVRNNAGNSGVPLMNAEVDAMWEAYKHATLEGQLRPYGSPSDGGNTPIVLAVEKATGFPRAKVVAFLNGLLLAVNDQGWGTLWLDPAGAMNSDPVSGALVDPMSALKRAGGDIGEALRNLLKPVADPLTNVLKWGAVMAVSGASIYGIWYASKFFKGRKGRKG